MKFSRWAIPLLIRLLSLSGLTSATGEIIQPITIGLQMYPTTTSLSPQSQPRLEFQSLELGFILQIASHEFKVPIMPLHLLGKKSWNVYNTDNIERVRKDEAAAKALEEAEEQRMQELDAERRIQILRGEIPTPVPIEDAPASPSSKAPKRERADYGSGRGKKRRKRAGENDTDFEMRVAREDRERNEEQQIVLRKKTVTDAPVVDQRGNISLFPQPAPEKSESAEGNKEVEREEARKKKEYEDQYMLKFSNAAGFKQGLENPWYSKPVNGNEEDVEEEVVGKDVWGNEDPRRREREKARIANNDPLAMMKAGARQVREVEKERKRWREEKEKEMRELEEAERRKRRKRRRDVDDDDLEGFRLDDDRDRLTRSSHRTEGDREKDGERRHRHKHSSRSEHRDEDRRHRHQHRSRHHN